MKNLIKIYGKYVAVTWGIIFLLLLGNLGVLLYVTGESMILDETYLGGLSDVEDLLDWDWQGGGKLREGAEELLKERGYVFLFLLDEQGDVVFDWQYPADFSRHYTIGEIAAFSKWYLKDYPVKVYRSKYGLLVVGYEKNSIWKYTVEFSMAFMDRLGKYFCLGILINLLIILLVVGFLGYRFYLSLKPFTEGVKKLSQNRRVRLDEAGTMSGLAAQLNRTSDILEEQRRSLERKDRARAEWIAGVSHDIRTPLSLIMGYADQLENDGSLMGEEKKKAEIIRLQSVKIRQLIEDLNLVSRLDHEKEPLRIREFYPAALLRELVAEIYNEGYGEKHEITLSLAENFASLRMKGDEKLLARAVRNLIYNSIFHNARGCDIFVMGKLGEEGIWIAVRDTGCGIPQTVQKLLKEEGREKEEGNNEKKPHIMGLDIVRRITLAHGGDFEIEEEGHLAALKFPLSLLVADKPEA